MQNLNNITAEIIAATGAAEHHLTVWTVAVRGAVHMDVVINRTYGGDLFDFEAVNDGGRFDQDVTALTVPTLADDRTTVGQVLRGAIQFALQAA